MSGENEIAVVVLAAGMGTRMKSEKAKVLHEIAGKTMISYVLETAMGVTSCENIVVVVGCQAEAVCEEARRKGKVVFAHQRQQLGTGHAVLCAMDALPGHIQDVVILCGDVPFISRTTIKALVKKKRQEDLDICLLAVDLDSPTGYGRIIFDRTGRVVQIIEESDADDQEKALTVVNAGTYCVDKSYLAWSLGQIRADNAQQELYLTDIVGIAPKNNKRAGALILKDKHEIIGVNSRDDLERAVRSLGQKSA